MSNPMNAAFGYDAGSFEVKCPECGKTNKVSVTEQDGHNEREEYYCANCRAELGKVKASNTPRTEIID